LFFFATAWWHWLLLPVDLFNATIHFGVMQLIGWTHLWLCQLPMKTLAKTFSFDFLNDGRRLSQQQSSQNMQIEANFGVKWYEIDVHLCK